MNQNNDQASPPSSSPKIFFGLHFLLLGFDPVEKHKVHSKLIDNGGIDIGKYGPNCTHVIVGNLVYDDPICVTARKDGKTVVTGLWVDRSCDFGVQADAQLILYRPVKDFNGIPNSESLCICLTGYSRNDRDDIMRMAGLMGAQFTKPLVASKVTHLICYKFEGEKYEVADKQKKIKLVNHKWLEDCLRAWKILPEGNYNKSGYEVEIIEAEAKKSEEVTEKDTASKEHKSKNVLGSPILQTTIVSSVSSTSKLPLIVGKVSKTQKNVATLKRLSDFGEEVETNDVSSSAPKSDTRSDKFRGLQNVNGNNFGEFFGLSDENYCEERTNKDGSELPTSKIFHHSGEAKLCSPRLSMENPRRSPVSISSCGQLEDQNIKDDIDMYSAKLGQEDETDHGREIAREIMDRQNVGSPQKRKADISHASIKSPKKRTPNSEDYTKRSLPATARPGGSTVGSREIMENGSQLEGPILNFAENQFAERPEIKSVISDKILSGLGFADLGTIDLENMLATPAGSEQSNLVTEANALDAGTSRSIEVLIRGKRGQQKQDHEVPIPITKDCKIEKSKSPLTIKKSSGRPMISRGNKNRCKGSFDMDKIVISDGAAFTLGGAIDREKSGNKFSVKPEMDGLTSKTYAVIKEMAVKAETIPQKDDTDGTEFEKAASVMVERTSTANINTEEKPDEIYYSPTAKKVKGMSDEPVALGKEIEVLKIENIVKKTEMGGLFSGALEKKEVEKHPSRRTRKKEVSSAKEAMISEEASHAKQRKASNSGKIDLEKKKRTKGRSIHTKSNSGAVYKKKCTEVDEEEKTIKIGDLKVNLGESSRRKGNTESKTPPVQTNKMVPGTHLVQSQDRNSTVATCELTWFILSGDRLQRKEFQQLIKRLKGRCCRHSHQWSDRATHFIVPGPVRRTEKFFAASASGRWILKADYLTASNQAGRFVEEEPYEWFNNSLTEDGAISLDAPRKWRLLRNRTGHGAFFGMRIIVYGHCMVPPLDTLKRVMRAGDGTILATSPPYTRFLDSDVDYAVISTGMPQTDSWVQEFLRHKIPCISADYLVEYVCKPGYSLNKHVLYKTHAWAEMSFGNLLKRCEQTVEVSSSSLDYHEDLACQVCGSVERGEVMLICGDEGGSLGCGIGTHIDCCDPPLDLVPEEDWFCARCIKSRSSNKHPKRLKKGASSVEV